MNHELQSQISLALLSSFGLQWLKGQKWFPLVSYETGKMNAIVAALVAALSAGGILVKYDAGTLTITGLTLASVGMFLYHTMGQYLLQHAAYRGLIAPPKPGVEQEQVRQEVISRVEGATSPQPPASS